MKIAQCENNPDNPMINNKNTSWGNPLCVLCNLVGEINMKIEEGFTTYSTQS